MDSTVVCTLFKTFIIPYYLQIQLHFLYKLTAKNDSIKIMIIPGI